MIVERIANGRHSFGPFMMSFLIEAAVVDRGIPAYVDTPVGDFITDAWAVHARGHAIPGFYIAGRHAASRA